MSAASGTEMRFSEALEAVLAGHTVRSGKLNSAYLKLDPATNKILFWEPGYAPATWVPTQSQVLYNNWEVVK